MNNHITRRSPPKSLEAKRFFSGFMLAHEAYNAITYASDGRIYYALSSRSIHTGGQMYSYDPVTDKIEFLGDLTECCGEKQRKTIPQGKVHTELYERHGKLYFSSHVSYYETIDGIERLPVKAPEGFDLYPGGHIFSYDLATKELKDLAILPNGEGIITMTMDEERGHIYAISWPKGNFIHYDVEKDKLKDIGPVSGPGESGNPGENFRVLCRCMFVDPASGAVYFSTAEGDIYFYMPTSESLSVVEGISLKLDYFGKYDVTKPGSMGYNWRKIAWYPTEEIAYGVHGNSGYLFRFDPRQPSIELVERITSEASKRRGMYDLSANGYLGFQLGPDKQTLYYLTGGPISFEEQRLKEQVNMSKDDGVRMENLHLVTYNIPRQKYTDHGPVFFKDGTRPAHVNSIAIDKDGNIYTLARFQQGENMIQDLIKIPNPFLRTTPDDTNRQ